MFNPKKIVQQLDTGNKVVARVMGSGPNLIFLTHGMGNNWYSWSALSKFDTDNHFTFVSIDFPGYGESDRLEEYSYEILADSIVEFTTKYLAENKGEYKSVGCGGYSMGSIVTSLISSKKLELYDHYIMMAPVYESGLSSVGTRYLSWLGRAALRINVVSWLYRKFYLSNIYTIVYYFSMYNFSLAIVNEYSIPPKFQVDFNAFFQLSTKLYYLNLIELYNNRDDRKKHLIIIGDHDRLIDVKALVDGRTLKFGSDTTVNVMTESGHLPLYEQPKQAYEVLRKYIS